MTAVQYVTPSQMKAKTGADALGYAKPSEDTVYLVEGMPERLEKIVRAHEFEHIEKGEEGPFLSKLVGAVAGPVLSAFSSDRAADQAAEGNAAALAEQRRQFDLARQDLAPAVDAGNQGRQALLDFLGISGNAVDPTQVIRSTPGFDFQMDQGRRAIDASAAARGGLLSGNVIREATEFGQGMADSTFQNYLTRLQQIASDGQVAASGQAGAAQNSAFANSSLINRGGEINAAGTLGVSNSIGDLLNNIGDLLGRRSAGSTGSFNGGIPMTGGPTIDRSRMVA